MKQTKVTSLKAGFSLVEMLVVIAIIGIIAAIAIPNIGSINDSAREASAKRNAQSIASVLNAAIAAGVTAQQLGFTADVAPGNGTTTSAVLTIAETGVAPADGAFQGKTFTVGNIDDDEEALASKYISYDFDNHQVVYDSDL
jgi:type IV pilus assembly protein PilA